MHFRGRSGGSSNNTVNISSQNSFVQYNSNSQPPPFKKDKPPKVNAVELLKDCDYSGWLQKQGGSVKNWRKRFVILHQGSFYYYASATDKQPKGTISVAGVLCTPGTENYLIKIITKHRTFYLNCDSEKERESWLQALQNQQSFSKKFHHVISSEITKSQTLLQYFTSVQLELINSIDHDTKYHSLQEFLRNEKSVNNADSIVLRPGLYYHEQCVTLTQPVKLKSAIPSDHYAIVTSMMNTANECMFRIDLSQLQHTVTACVRLKHLTLLNEPSTMFFDIIHVVEGSTLVVEQCFFLNASSCAIKATQSSQLLIKKCTFKNCATFAILLQENANAVIEDCIFEDNDVGICVQQLSSAKIINCQFIKNRQCAISVETNVVNSSSSGSTLLPTQIIKNRFVSHVQPIKLINQASAEMTNNEMIK